MLTAVPTCSFLGVQQGVVTENQAECLGYGKGDFAVPVFPEERVWSAFQSAAVSFELSGWWGEFSALSPHLWFSAHHPHLPLAKWVLSSFTGASEEQP